MDEKTDQDASDQLQSELQSSLRRAHLARKPIITHLNADTSWLLSFPYPNTALAPVGRSRYNILIDPWFKGTQEDVAGWFSKQWHSVKSSVESAEELNELLQAAEKLDQDPVEAISLPARGASLVDAIMISHEFTDHCHRATLSEFSKDVPVYASTKAAELVRSWKYFDTVREVSAFGAHQDWRIGSQPPLPDWIGLSRIITKSDALYYHSALMICARRSEPGQDMEAANAYIYTPHGVEASTLSVLHSAHPPVNVVALLHGLHDVSIFNRKQLNLGATNAIKAQKIIRAKYWIGTHDEEKSGSGIIAPLLRRKVWNVADALTSVDASEIDQVQDMEFEELQCIELGNGESLLLE